MGFLKKFFRNVFHEGATQAATWSSFDLLSDMELETHLSVSRYGDFELTDALRPSYDLKVRPRQGYRHDVYVDEESRSRVPVLMAAVSKERLFDTFMDLIDPLGPVVDVVLETSHDPSGSGHVDLYREHIDMPVLKSILFDFEDLLTNDGCTGIAVLNPNTPQEVQFDEHKLLIVYAGAIDVTSDDADGSPVTERVTGPGGFVVVDADTPHVVAAGPDGARLTEQWDYRPQPDLVTTWYDVGWVSG